MATDPTTNDEKRELAPDDFLVVEGLKKTFGKHEVLRGVDFTLRRGETMAFLGASGGGKSVILRHILGLVKPDSGCVKIDGDDITGLSERKLGPIRRKVGILFQNGALFDSMSVAQNVAFPLREDGIRSKQEIFQRVHEALSLVGLEEHLEKMPSELSGGMRKRVALARAIITRPSCILYDEPTAGLDPVATDVIDRLIMRMQESFNVCSIVVTHHLASAWRISNRVTFLRNGKILRIDTPDGMRSADDPAIQDFLHGRSQKNLQDEN